MEGFKQRLLPLLLLCLAAVVGWAGNPAPAVVPAVRQWTGGKGVWKFSGAQVAVPAAEWPVLEPVAKRFAADLTLMGMTSVAVPVTGDLSTRDLVLTTNTGNFRLRNDEGYAVEITDRVVIRGQTATAVLWGTRTLLQMLHQDRQLPRGTVADWPQYPHRILQLNVGNHYLPLTMLKDYVACMSWFKLNELQLCLDGAETGERPQGFFRVECDTIPGLTSREHYTRQQLRELQDWAALHGVVVIPEIRFPGAALAFTRIAPDLRASGLDAAQIDVRNPAACLFLQRLFDEIIPLFDARLVHLGSPDYSLDQVAAGQLPEWTEACRKHLDRLSTYAQSRFNKSIRIWETSQRLPEMNVPMRTTTIDVWQKSEIAGVRLAAGRKIINSSIALPSITPESPDLQLASRSL